MDPGPMAAVRDLLLSEFDANGREAGILTWLAWSAWPTTRLCWPGYKTLGKLARCGKNLIGPAMKRLVDTGNISILERRGRGAIYLVHPGGLAAMPRLVPDAVRDHLRVGRFGKADIDAVVTWLTSLGVLLQGVPTVGTPAGTVSRQAGRQRPHSRDSGVPAVGTERKEKGKRMKIADPRPTKMGGLAGATARPIADVPEDWAWATPEAIAAIKADAARALSDGATGDQAA